jgi:lipoprotein-anchoring transpeptidase ErfK/SrfK
VPAASGEGRRIVFSQSEQRVWLVGDDGSVDRTYLVSGSRFDNLDPGSYRVQSKTRDATAFDASGTMEYFVRFATGYSEPIGFHSVPRDNRGKLEQTKGQLGTPLSAGCVRQWKDDAIALWEFAPIGTSVVVTP